MTQQEFEARTGKTVTPEEYARIEAMYIYSGRRHGQGPILCRIQEVRLECACGGVLSADCGSERNARSTQ